LVGSDIIGICSVEIHYCLFSEVQIRVFVVQDQIRILMVFVFVVVLEVVGTMMFLVPSFDHDSLIPFSCGLEEFLDFWCNLILQEDIQIPLFVQWRRKFL